MSINVKGLLNLNALKSTEMVMRKIYIRQRRVQSAHGGRRWE